MVEPVEHSASDDSTPPDSTPLDALGVIGSQDVMITPMLRHAEFFTMRGLLSLLWHEPDDLDAWLPAVLGI